MLVIAVMASGCASIQLPWTEPEPPAVVPPPAPPVQAPRKPRPLAMRPADGGEVERSALARFIADEYGAAPSLATRIVDAAYESGARHDLPPALLLAITARESTFRPQATNGYGAVGLMQVVPRFHRAEVERRGGAGALLHPETNIDVGARILARYRREQGNLRDALTRYSGKARGYFGKVAAKWRVFDRVRDRARVRPHKTGQLAPGPFGAIDGRFAPAASGFLEVDPQVAALRDAIGATVEDARSAFGGSPQAGAGDAGG